MKVFSSDISSASKNMFVANGSFFKSYHSTQLLSGNNSANKNFFAPAIRSELSHENQQTQNPVADNTQSAEALDTKKSAPCSYNVVYGNPRLLTVPNCGGQVQFDILQVTSSNPNCQKELKGKQLSEVVTSDNNCIKTPVITGPPVTLMDNGYPASPATDTYGINIPRENAIDCSFGIPCTQIMTQVLSLDGKPVTTNTIKFEICGDKHGCMTRIFLNGLFLGTVGTGAYRDLTEQQQ